MHPVLSNGVAFVGLGAMGLGMASHLVKSGYEVVGFDVYEPSRVRFRDAGGKIADSPRDAARGAKFFICMVANSQQVDSVLFDADIGAAEGIVLLDFALSKLQYRNSYIEHLPEL
jgi:3-hydroxyisobutyrate dehydrogenase-like beta-hydroxyacid dehydrogenase